MDAKLGAEACRKVAGEAFAAAGYSQPAVGALWDLVFELKATEGDDDNVVVKGKDGATPAEVVERYLASAEARKYNLHPDPDPATEKDTACRTTWGG